ncbi:M17 family peptidase N-terminal domain-containing protein, partial [Sphingomonas bacterium]|uniref:M17 family peptidase N-terminal domain-containing protein n=1 Tax=Sphingomonas bacterium TaxID=1895847 RepID=UPI00266F8CF4
MLTIGFAVDRPAAKHVLVLPLLSSEGAARALPATLKGGEPLLLAAIDAARFSAEPGSLVELHVAEGDGVTHLLMVGIGGARDGFKAGGAIVQRLLTSGATSAAVDLTHIAAADRATLAAAIAEAASLRSWRQDAYRTKLPEKQKPSLTLLTIVAGDRVEEAEAAWAPRKAVVEGVAFTRMLVTEPANLLYPQSFVEHALSGRELGLEIEVLGEEEMRAAGMGALLGVAQGSEREAQLLVMKWDGTGGAVQEPTAFVGKGVTFDTGGISLKPGPGMEDM